MSAFYPSGPAVALPRLRAQPIEGIERRLRLLNDGFPVALVVPMIPSEMDRPQGGLNAG